MNDRMFAHPQVQANLAHLRKHLGYGIAGPAEGALAVGEGEGPGRMLEPWQIVEHVGRALARDARWSDAKVLVTAGPTREPLDPVRYLTNRSSGKMGYALAQAAWRRGAAVTLVSGPSSLPEPVGVDLVPVETAREMHASVMDLVCDADVSIFAAAVADYRPADTSDQKIKRSEAGPSPSVELASNPDIALESGKKRKTGSVAIGFALETQDLMAHARTKLEAKSFDLLVANAATHEDSGFEVDTNQVTLLSKEGPDEALPLLDKNEVAEEILDRVTALWEAR